MLFLRGMLIMYCEKCMSDCHHYFSFKSGMSR